MWKKSLCSVVLGLLACGQALCTEYRLDLEWKYGGKPLAADVKEYVLRNLTAYGEELLRKSTLDMSGDEVKFVVAPAAPDVTNTDNSPAVDGQQVDSSSDEQRWEKALGFFEKFGKPLHGGYFQSAAIHGLRLEKSNSAMHVYMYARMNIGERLDRDNMAEYLVKEAKSGNDACKHGLQQIYVKLGLLFYRIGICDNLRAVTKAINDNSPTKIGSIYRVTEDGKIEATYSSVGSAGPDWTRAVEVFSAAEVRDMFGDLVD